MSSRGVIAVDPRFNKGSRDWQNLFAITRLLYIFIYFTFFRVKKIVCYAKHFVI